MASIFGTEKREVIRIKVKKCEGMLQPEYKKMSVDPELTSFDILIRLLAKAFQIKGNFTVSYLARDDLGQDVYLSLLSDWDMDAAFLGASDPYLRLKVDLRPFEEGMEDWDVVAPTEVANSNAAQTRSTLGLDARAPSASILGSITGAVTAGVGKTARTVSKVIGLKQEETTRYHLAKPPMTDPEFRYFLDAVGHMVRPEDFRLMVYQGGVEASLRGVVWRHLLNVYPNGLSGRERFEYQRKKCNEYYRLRDEWKDLFSKGRGTEDMRFVANLVKKDVLRTDRAHKVYAGSDDSANVLSLFNILVTYAMTHPDVSYCQGMSDLASPILVVERDEATAYLCFCGLMKRLRKNFNADGHSMTRMLEHLALLLQHRDPDFYAYLKSQGANDMFFTYRWLILELKREFPLDDALLMLEVMWSSLPPDPPEEELELADPEYSLSKLIFSPQSPSGDKVKENYLKIKSLRKKFMLRPDFDVGNEEMADKSPGDGTGIGASTEPSECTAITPAEEMKNFDPNEFEPAEDSATQELLDRCSSIDESLKTKPALFAKENAALKSQNEMNQSVLGNTSEMTIEVPSDNKVRNMEDRDAPPSSPKRPGTIVLKKTFVPNRVTNNDVVESGLKQPGDGSVNLRNVEVSGEAVSHKHNSLEHSSPKGGVISDVTSAKSDDHTSSDAVCASTDSPHIGDASDNPMSSQSKPHASDAKLASSSDTSTPRKTRHTLVLTENGVAEETVVLNSCEEATESEGSHPSIDFIKVQEKLPKLPAPHEFGDGNPFLMFLCLTLLVQERDHIVQKGMDLNDLAMHFDRMVRRHDVYKVLHQAQSLYAVYLRAQTMAANSDSSEDVSV